MAYNPEAWVIDGTSIYRKIYHAIENSEDFSWSKFEELIGFKLRGFVFKTFLREIKYGVAAIDNPNKEYARSEIYPQYKKSRDETPAFLKENHNKIKQVFENFGLKVIEAPHKWEGDDVVATVSSFLSKNKIRTSVITVDKDLLQLVDEKVSVTIWKHNRDIITNTLWNFKILNKGLTPQQLPQVQALAGDEVDNYKGVKGIGLDRAIRLIKEYGSVKEVYRHIDFIPENLRGYLEGQDYNAKICLQIATLKKDLDLGLTLDNLKIERTKFEEANKKKYVIE